MKHGHERSFILPFNWPAAPLHVVLVEPEIPPNTGTIARLCAATGTILDLIEPLGFQLTDRNVKRAGLDYWDAVDVRRHVDFDTFTNASTPSRCIYFSTAAKQSYTDFAYRPGDALVFGSEGKGLPDEIVYSDNHTVRGIPMLTEHVRSLNLATAVGIVLYEALRQINAPHGQGVGSAD